MRDAKEDYDRVRLDVGKEKEKRPAAAGTQGQGTEVVERVDKALEPFKQFVQNARYGEQVFISRANMEYKAYEEQCKAEGKAPEDPLMWTLKFFGEKICSMTGNLSMLVEEAREGSKEPEERPAKAGRSQGATQDVAMQQALPASTAAQLPAPGGPLAQVVDVPTPGDTPQTTKDLLAADARPPPGAIGALMLGC